MRHIMAKKSGDEKGLGAVALLAALPIVGVITFWGVVIWAIIKLVSHFTGG